MFDFDGVFDRSKTDCVKYSKAAFRRHFDGEEVLPFWVADMDFKAAPAIVDAVVKRAQEGIYGYPETGRQNESFARWVKKRFNWSIDTDWVVNTPGVVPALNMAVQTFTKLGDNVIIQSPVYYPFANAIINNGRHVLNNQLTIAGSQFAIDFDDLEIKASLPNTTLMLVCSPHNPGGRVWSEEELRRVMTICLRNGVKVVSDEIHADLIMPGFRHTPSAKLGSAIAQNLIVCMAPSKTFNLAGMHFANIVIPNNELRRQFKRTLEQRGEGKPGSFAMAAAIAAYDRCEDWVEACLDYLNKNVHYTHEFLNERIRGIRFFEQQGTYLVWMDFRALGLTDTELERIIFHEAKVGLDSGRWFGKGGTGFMRMNVACPRTVLTEGLERIAAAFESRGYSANESK